MRYASDGFGRERAIPRVEIDAARTDRGAARRARGRGSRTAASRTRRPATRPRSARTASERATMSSDCCEPVVITTSSASTSSPRAVQPLRDRLAQRRVALRVVLAGHPLAQHRARALGDPLGRQQLGIDEHGRQRRSFRARAEIGARQRRRHEQPAAAPRRPAPARRTGVGGEHEHAFALARLDEARARPARRTRPARCSSTARAASRARAPAAAGCPRAVRRVAISRCTLVDDICGGRAAIGDGNVQADIGRPRHGSG